MKWLGRLQLGLLALTISVPDCAVLVFNGHQCGCTADAKLSGQCCCSTGISKTCCAKFAAATKPVRSCCARAAASANKSERNDNSGKESSCCSHNSPKNQQPGSGGLSGCPCGSRVTVDVTFAPKVAPWRCVISSTERAIEMVARHSANIDSVPERPEIPPPKHTAC